MNTSLNGMRKTRMSDMTISIKPMLFHGSIYSPEGGWLDYGGCYDSIEVARGK